MNRSLVICFIVAMLLVSYVHALGIAPGHTDITFQPGAEEKVKLKLMNQEAQEFKVVLYAEGELAEYITFDEPMVEFKSADSEKYVYYTIKLPSQFDKQGIHTTNIVARAVSSGSSSGGVGVNANIAIGSKLNVMVPYSGKYAELTLFSPNFEQGKENNFAVEVKNLGTEDILQGQVVIDILGPTNAKLASVSSDTFRLSSKENKVVTINWDPQVSPGNYVAVASLVYDGGNAKDQRTFTIGSQEIEITDISVKDFKLGGIAMFEIMLENRWNEPISGVYGDISVKDESGKSYTEFKTASVNINTQEKQKIQAYWDTKSAGPGKYKLGVALNYLGKKTEKVFDILVSADRIDTDLGGMAVTNTAKDKEPLLQGVYILIFLVIILIIFNIIMFFRKSKKKD